MIKIDFHIHTVVTASDADFSFSMEKLTEYVHACKLDSIAVTNHNHFDLAQFMAIRDKVTITIFPGIEIDLEGGQLLLISGGKELEDFAVRCQGVSNSCSNKKDSLSVERLKQIFGDLSNYILIPHYDKKPQVSDQTIAKLAPFITAGEVTSPKKFIYCQKDADRLVPVYFSDCRIGDDMTKFPVRQTYLNCDVVSFSAIRNCLRDKTKVSLSESEGNATFQIFDDGQELSTGLNVIIGERSSGKSFTLERIRDQSDNPRYIEQFSLVARDEKEDQRKFDRQLSDKHSQFSREYLGELQSIVQDIMDIDIDEDSRAVSAYLESLTKHARETEKHDVYSKSTLFGDTEFQISNQKGLTDLIGSVQNLIENVEFRPTIENHVSIDSLKKLIVDLMEEYSRREQERRKRTCLNELIKEIKGKLQVKSAATTIAEVDLYSVAMNLVKVDKFNTVVGLARMEREVVRKPLQGFEIVATAGEFTGASQLKNLSGRVVTFSKAYGEYADPYKYLLKLKQIEGLEQADLYKYFVNIEFKILNKDGFEVSGGERSEFNLLQEIQDAQKFDMLLIDEPESSFDNIFLGKEVNGLIKDISKHMPVVIVTHNSTVGASIKPDFLLCTKKEVSEDGIRYRIYSGYPTSNQLMSVDGNFVSNWRVTLGCLEAGQEAYEERRRGYEDLKD